MLKEKLRSWKNLHLFYFIFSKTNMGFGLKWVAHLREQLVHSVWCYCSHPINISIALFEVVLNMFHKWFNTDILVATSE